MWHSLVACILVLSTTISAVPFNTERTNLNSSADVPVKVSEERIPVPLEDVLGSKFAARGFTGSWISETEYTFYQDGDLKKRDITKPDDEPTIVISKAILDFYKSDQVTLNAQNTKALIRHSKRQLFRHSFLAKYLIVNIPDPAEGSEYRIADDVELQNCIWSPTGEAVAFVNGNNVFYDELDDEENAIQITTDGDENIYNGMTDWVYEEEVFGSFNALWFNPTGTKLAFGYFDDTHVGVFSYFMYNEVKIDKEEDKITGQYPQEIELNYPKVGTDNPKVKVKLIDLENIQDPIELTEILPPAELNEPILSSVGYVNEDWVAIMWQNRRQNEAITVAYKLDDPEVVDKFIEQKEPNGWVYAQTLSCFKSDNDDDDNAECFILRNNDGWPRLFRIDRVNKNSKYVTPLGVTVLQFLGWNHETDVAYVIGTGNNFDPIKDPALRHLYAINANSELECISCEIETPEGNKCSYVTTVRFSKDYSYYFLTCSGPDPSFTYIYKTDEATEPFDEYEANTNLRNTLKGYLETKFKYLRVPVGGEFQAIVKCRMPECYEEGTTQKFPMIIDVYAGPNSVRVLDNFGMGYGDYWAQTRNVFYCSIDGRGTGNKGTEMLFTLNNALGTVEIEDQIVVTKYLRDTYSFIDPNRIGIWGWSYGGYATGMVLTHDKDHVFQGGISVAPVSSWIYYDTIYTERYMGLPTEEDNLAGYNVSDLNRYAENMKEHEYFLIHGNADDNVHYQQAMAFAKALQHANVLFEQHSYPDEAHSLSGVTKHLYHSMVQFWERILKLPSAENSCLSRKNERKN